MTVTAVLPPAGAGGSKTDLGAARLAENFDQFLTLLTTQLRHQDPLQPLSSEEFVGQLVKFTGVEQAIATNRRLEELIAVQTQNQALAAIGYIGHTVEAVSGKVPLVGGQAELAYQLDHSAAATRIVIQDAAERVVRVANGATTPGKHVFAWDGRDGNGNALPDGVYKIAVVAQGANDESTPLETRIRARVDGVESTDQGVLLSLGPLSVAVDKVVSVRAAALAASSGGSFDDPPG